MANKLDFTDLSKYYIVKYSLCDCASHTPLDVFEFAQTLSALSGICDENGIPMADLWSEHSPEKTVTARMFDDALLTPLLDYIIYHYDYNTNILMNDVDKQFQSNTPFMYQYILGLYIFRYGISYTSTNALVSYETGLLDDWLGSYLHDTRMDDGISLWHHFRKPVGSCWMTCKEFADTCLADFVHYLTELRASGDIYFDTMAVQKDLLAASDNRSVPSLCSLDDIVAPERESVSLEQEFYTKKLNQQSVSDPAASLKKEFYTNLDLILAGTEDSATPACLAAKIKDRFSKLMLGPIDVHSEDTQTYTELIFKDIYQLFDIFAKKKYARLKLNAIHLELALREMLPSYGIWPVLMDDRTEDFISVRCYSSRAEAEKAMLTSVYDFLHMYVDTASQFTVTLQVHDRGYTIDTDSYHECWIREYA